MSECGCQITVGDLMRRDTISTTTIPSTIVKDTTMDITAIETAIGLASSNMLLSPLSAANLRATARDIVATPSIGAIASGAIGFVTFPAIGLRYTARLTFAAPDGTTTTGSTQIELVVGQATTGSPAGQIRHFFLTGEVVGSNANACSVNVCEVQVAVGALESFTVQVRNISAGALAAGASMTLKCVRAFDGEKNFEWTGPDTACARG